MSTEVKVDRIPRCNFCDRDATVDGKTVFGPWANMCENHWLQNGVGQLGTGFGQRLVKR